MKVYLIQQQIRSDLNVAADLVRLACLRRITRRGLDLVDLTSRVRSELPMLDWPSVVVLVVVVAAVLEER